MQGGLVTILGGFLGLALLAVPAAMAAPPQQDRAIADPPAWAYPINPLMTGQPRMMGPSSMYPAAARL